MLQIPKRILKKNNVAAMTMKQTSRQHLIIDLWEVIIQEKD